MGISSKKLDVFLSEEGDLGTVEFQYAVCCDLRACGVTNDGSAPADFLLPVFFRIDNLDAQPFEQTQELLHLIEGQKLRRKGVV
jgi:hypothetical protein